MGTRLYVGNLSYDTLDDDLRTLFAENGNVVSCEVMIDRQTGRSKGFAFVEMGSQDEANKAIETCNGKSFQLMLYPAELRAHSFNRTYFTGKMARVINLFNCVCQVSQKRCRPLINY